MSVWGRIRVLGKSRGYSYIDSDYRRVYLNFSNYFSKFISFCRDATFNYRGVESHENYSVYSVYRDFQVCCRLQTTRETQ